MFNHKKMIYNSKKNEDGEVLQKIQTAFSV